MQSQAFKMNPNKDFLKAKQALSFNNYLPRHEERTLFPRWQSWTLEDQSHREQWQKVIFYLDFTKTGKNTKQGQTFSGVQRQHGNKEGLLNSKPPSNTVLQFYIRYGFSFLYITNLNFLTIEQTPILTVYYISKSNLNYRNSGV